MDVFSMKFIGSIVQVPLQSPSSDSRTEQQSWVALPSGATPLLCVGDLRVHPQLHLYLEVCQKSSRAGGTPIDVSCGYALLPLKDVKGSPNQRELAVSGGTPFKPRPIKQGLAGGAVLGVKFGEIDKAVAVMVEKRELPPNTLCTLPSALPITQVRADDLSLPTCVTSHSRHFSLASLPTRVTSHSRHFPRA